MSNCYQSSFESKAGRAREDLSRNFGLQLAAKREDCLGFKEFVALSLIIVLGSQSLLHLRAHRELDGIIARGSVCSAMAFLTEL